MSANIRNPLKASSSCTSALYAVRRSAQHVSHTSILPDHHHSLPSAHCPFAAIWHLRPIPFRAFQGQLLVLVISRSITWSNIAKKAYSEDAGMLTGSDPSKIGALSTNRRSLSVEPRVDFLTELCYNSSLVCDPIVKAEDVSEATATIRIEFDSAIIPKNLSKAGTMANLLRGYIPKLKNPSL